MKRELVNLALYKNILIEPILETENFKLILENLENGNTPILASGVLDSQKSHLIACIREKIKNPMLIITSSELRAKEIEQDLNFFFKKNVQVLMYPSKDVIFYSADVRSKDIVKQRFDVLNTLMSGKRFLLVLSIESLFDRLTPKNKFEDFILELEEGMEIDPEKLIENLILMGYERRDLVEAAGQFAVRGGIIDIFTTINQNAIRIEFYGDEIDSIRIFDTKSQRSIEREEKVKIFPMRELVYGQEELDSAISRLKKEYDEAYDSYEQKGLLSEANLLKDNFLEVIEKLEENQTISGVDRFFKYFYEEEATLINYLNKKTIIYFDDLPKIESHANNTYYEFSESVKNRILKGYLLPSQMDMIFSYEKILNDCKNFSQIIFSSAIQPAKNIKFETTANFRIKSTPVFKNRLGLLTQDLVNWLDKGINVVILAGSKTRGKRLTEDFLDQNINAKYIDYPNRIDLPPKTVFITSGSLSKGFEYVDEKLIVISDKDLFKADKDKKQVKRKKLSQKIESFTDLRIGDYIVHDNHGIGVYKGIETLVADGASRDYLRLKYSDEGNLYVPTNQMDMIQKYVGANSVRPKMNKLGSTEWHKSKVRTRGIVKVLAENLVELYAKRQATKGFEYNKDTVWQREFEESFPYDETDDQLKAIEEVKKDMESTKVMDRLICGDVGYGKTEVAIRAAFKAVQDSKQVAYLVPTTILAQQHYNTFVDRMKRFPVKIGVLSRFRSKKEQQQIIEDLKKGLLDIVIGTHRLLSKDMAFKDIGLIIIDEEQRFGVAHKEKLKRIKGNIDVLTLTATPIPRTLHMSLIGVRDISTLQEPPQERQPIQTYVMEYSAESIKDAIHRELARNGQVYYLHNRIKDIDEVTFKLQLLVPEAVIACIHGKVSENELENIMMDFSEGKIDVLVCTTIIETGLDIANVNTIIIQDADHMGLSQLHQLRGRVGRSNRIAYSYLMYKKDKILEENADKRLQTITDFTEFGSGFKIALRDLEIRGAGNLLGEQQHGHMELVGYDMYCRLLDNAVKELQGEVTEEVSEISIDIKISAYIPADYIFNEQQKFDMYRKISFITNIEDYYDVQEETEDRYGDIPNTVQNLLDIALLKAVATSVDITSLAQKKFSIIITFKSDARVSIEKIMSLVVKHADKLTFTAAMEPYITYKSPDDITIKDIVQLRNMLETLK